MAAELSTRPADPAAPADDTLGKSGQDDKESGATAASASSASDGQGPAPAVTSPTSLLACLSGEVPGTRKYCSLRVSE